VEYGADSSGALGSVGASSDGVVLVSGAALPTSAPLRFQAYTPTNEDYRITWYVDGAHTTAGVTDTSKPSDTLVYLTPRSGAILVTAKFERVYSVAIAGGIAYPSARCIAGETVTLSHVAGATPSGYAFKGWKIVKGDGASLDNGTNVLTVGTSDVVVEAVYESILPVAPPAPPAEVETPGPTEENNNRAKEKVSAEWIWIPVVLGTLCVLLACLTFEYYRRRRAYSKIDDSDSTES
jgi:hypothetical protein